MKELQSIIEAYREIEQKNTQAALATVVRVRGSAYRRAGARMLITANGHTVGSVSGGCLERDVLNQARRVLQWNEPRVIAYDSMSDEDIAWEFNLGCNGIVEVLIEPLSHTGEQGHMAFLTECLQHRQVAVLATVFGVEGPIKAKVGNRLMLSAQGAVRHDIGDGDLTEAILDDSQHALESSTSKTTAYTLSTGRAEVFIEVIQPSVPLVRFAKELGWHVTLVDSRPGYATRARFPLADNLIVCGPEEVCERIKIDRHTVAVIMTHNFPQDSELLRTLFPSPLRYIGMLGSKQRARRLFDQVQGTGRSHSIHSLGRLYGPIGLDIGADTPEEIALAVMAEIKAVLTGRLGGMLRTREGPLHEPSEGLEVVTVSGKINGAMSCGHGH